MISLLVGSKAITNNHSNDDVTRISISSPVSFLQTTVTVIGLGAPLVASLVENGTLTFIFCSLFAGLRMNFLGLTFTGISLELDVVQTVFVEKLFAVAKRLSTLFIFGFAINEDSPDKFKLGARSGIGSPEEPPLEEDPLLSEISEGKLAIFAIKAS